ncbi:TonB-dependent receptor domain-containing protein [Pseudoalteromonas tunicata]|uniref:TonB-dependent receptor n=1 Tax=Pseudoalteromonas tunicata D2 TaxID=87626 RepID=A4C3P6_9GAMM|nr:TonB-dependent receptor [Pseudoalteromonas tunicata]ATC96543.1 hypothetical protein PTUN_b0078 [Pseudoalteromonas tunicata]AXT33405.1 TonB-dependent receptor [Pseudoalteromonas tunicata]EAR30178.1 TonB-dependent receptor [Pseudoalteromonas tunicata D2]
MTKQPTRSYVSHLLIYCCALCLSAWHLCAFATTQFSLTDALFKVAKKHNWQLSMTPLNNEPMVSLLEEPANLNAQLEHLLNHTPWTYTLYPTLNTVVITARVLAKNNNNHDEAANALERILVSGQGSHNRSILSSSLSITHLNSAQLYNQVPFSTADTFNNAPGFWVENSGGETNNNVAPRGLRGGEGFRFISLLEDDLPVVYDGVWPDFFLRQDFTTAAIQIVRGGSSGIFSVNGPAANVNFIGQTGDNAQRKLKFTNAINYGYQRLDGVYSHQLSDNWYLLSGGFYRQSTGIREPGFNTDQGGQLSIRINQITPTYSQQWVVKYLEDKTSFFAPIPMQNQKKPRAINSLNAGTSTLLSNQLRYFFAPHGGKIRRYDLADGQQTRAISLTYLIDFSLTDSLLLSNKSRLSDLSTTLYTLMNQGNETLLPAKDWLSSAPVKQFLTHYLGSTAALYSPITQQYLDPTQLNNNGLVTFSYPLYAEYQQIQWINRLSLNWQMNEQTELMFGSLYANNDFSQLPHDRWLGSILTDVTHQPSPIETVALDPFGQKIATLNPLGVLSFSGPTYITGYGEAKSHSLYGNVRYSITDALTFDIGARTEWLQLTAVANTDQQNQYSQHQTITQSSPYRFKKSEQFTKTALSTGLNWQFADAAATFIRIANAFEMPKLLNFGNTLGYSSYLATIPDTVGFGRPVELSFIEWGTRIADTSGFISASLFETQFDPLPFTVYQGNQNTQLGILISTQTYGMELEFAKTLSAHWSISGVAVWQNGRFKGIPSQLAESKYNNNQITRTPNAQLRITQKYRFSQGELALTASYIGTRYSDVANQFALPAYYVVDASAQWALNEKLTLGLSINNLLDTIGLTEGNPRSGLIHQQNQYYARPIFGRALNLSLHYQF